MCEILTARDARQIAIDLDHLNDVRSLFRSHEALRQLLREVMESMASIGDGATIRRMTTLYTLPTDLRTRIIAALRLGT